MDLLTAVAGRHSNSPGETFAAACDPNRAGATPFRATAHAMPPVVYAFALSAFPLGFTDFVTIGLVPAIASSLHVQIEAIGGAVAAFSIGGVGLLLVSQKTAAR